MDLVGKIIEVCTKKSGVSKAGKPWESQEFVLETEGSHPEKCVFSVFGEEKLKEFNIQRGDVITVSINLDAREYNGRWYNSLQAWRVMKASNDTGAQHNNNNNNQQVTQSQQTQKNEKVSTSTETKKQEDSSDDLPF